MSYRYTNTEKWSDSWFSNLKQLEMLLFIYLCDNCDIAGFIEVNMKRWASDLNTTVSSIEGALKGLQRGFVFSPDGDCIFIKNFLKHQKNLPLNEANKAHVGIIKRFNNYSVKFDIQDINTFIQSPFEGGSKGLQRPTGNGNGNDIINNNYNNDTDNKIKSADEILIESIKPLTEKYGRELCLDFYNYWSERDRSGKKLRYQMEKTWDVEKRLARWKANQSKFQKIDQSTQTNSAKLPLYR